LQHQSYLYQQKFSLYLTSDTLQPYHKHKSVQWVEEKSQFYNENHIKTTVYTLGSKCRGLYIQVGYICTHHYASKSL